MEINAFSALALSSLMSLADPTPKPVVSEFELPAISGLWKIKMDDTEAETAASEPSEKPDAKTDSEATEQGSDDKQGATEQPTNEANEQPSDTKLSNPQIPNVNINTPSPMQGSDADDKNLTAHTTTKKPSKNTCQEYYNFGRNGILTTTSGDERTVGNYRFSYSEEFELPVLAIRTEWDNNAPDCLGNQIDQSGNSFAVFVRLNDRHEPTVMEWCNDFSGKLCHAFLHKVLP